MKLKTFLNVDIVAVQKFGETAVVILIRIRL
jgi:hypothetical protein